MKKNNSTDGFGYDLDEALKKGNFIEKFFHKCRISPWLNKIDYNGKKVLDVGCNTGILLIPLLEKGVDAIGVDISKSDIRKAQKKLQAKGFSSSLVLIADAKKLPFKNDSFDIVLLSDILEHVSEPELVAKETCRVVKQNGNIYATVPNEMHPVVKFEWLRKALSGRETVEEHPDEPYNLNKLINLFPNVLVEKSGFAGFWVQIFCKFKKI
ncbi:MAG: hypothetical protein A2694_01030 [Candidatus Blackburnbacteria bacterium RIFCSPHIGHO2_01_FULL_40_17]|nr:MAG: SAM-dependent methyltransferase [Microgenomates group bacterium GW2011_GWA2_39_19]OGY07343.1 MAG: hypothetical protein A2694_01030 [Candidatus Blackburnbacteria bacterium RIFCSPHIGHO2_01_FULL_40_17]